MLFGLGDMSAQYTRGEYKGRDFTSDVMGKLMDVLPLSIESNATDNLVEAATRTFTPDMISPITEAYLFYSSPILSNSLIIISFVFLACS